MLVYTKILGCASDFLGAWTAAAAAADRKGRASSKMSFYIRENRYSPKQPRIRDHGIAYALPSPKLGADSSRLVACHKAMWITFWPVDKVRITG